MAEQCDGCKFFNETGTSEETDASGNPVTVSVGECRRFPPSCALGGAPRFTPTKGTVWCGEYVAAT